MALLLHFVLFVYASADTQRYEKGDSMPLYADTIAPYNNPTETYPYYNLPFCKPSSLVAKSQSMGEVLQGSRKVYSPFEVPFAKPFTKRSLCTVELSAAEGNAFIRAIDSHYYYTLWYDEIPIRDHIGVVEGGRHYLFTHYAFRFTFNHDRVIEAVLDGDQRARVEIHPDRGTAVEFTYSADWTQTTVSFADRAANNANAFFEEEIDVQWFSIVNSFVLVILLTGFLAFIVLRILKKDYQKYMQLDEEDEPDDETGWKLLHGDVFRKPVHVTAFCALMGTGSQLLLLFVCMLTLAVVGVFYPYGRGTMYAAIILLYAATATLSGAVSGLWYRRLGNQEGKLRITLAASLLFPAPVFGVWAVLNSIAWAHGSTMALPFGTVCAILWLFFGATIPFTAVGVSIGGQFAVPWESIVPCRTKTQSRTVPQGPWYTSIPAHLFVAGFLPFSAIFVELYYAFISLWGHQLYTPYGILYLCFGVLLVVDASITVSLTYLQLSMEDHRWWPVSLFSGGSTAAFVFVYSFYFLVRESHMSGFLQVSYFVGYSLVLCYGLFLMLAAVGWYCSYIFVKQIYASIKCD
eukprot:TRINITY_DN13440_c0_g1_i1.p1 TRINITY_DN13440_c0_g1~~TRINITY_DN13440_c0_g1_i1.p1  ORF type:complete len:598 (+),score=72.01 TRINITY_DN13440_c0_g1_i1:67-1794(+)